MSLDSSGAEGNSRLTSVTGIILLLMLAVEGVTVLRVRQLITLHIYLGLLLLGPVVLKSASTMWRFGRYYSGSAPYVQKGPPHPVLRLLGPLVLVSSLVLLGSGIVVIAEARDHGGPWLTVHKATFFVWVAAMTIHVLGHLRSAAVESFDELRTRSPGRNLRFGLVVVALVAGVATASAVFPTASSWTSSHSDTRHAARERPPGG